MMKSATPVSACVDSDRSRPVAGVQRAGGSISSAGVEIGGSQLDVVYTSEAGVRLPSLNPRLWSFLFAVFASNPRSTTR